MINDPRKNSQFHGFTIVEVMLSVAIVIIVAVGTMFFQYNGLSPARQAEAELAATRLAQLLLEDWKSTGGNAAYDPNALGLGFTTITKGTNYTITLDYQTFYIQLTSQLAPITNGTNPDPVAGITLQQLSVTVSWRTDYAPGTIRSTDPTLTLTTFVRLDA